MPTVPKLSDLSSVPAVPTSQWLRRPAPWRQRLAPRLMLAAILYAGNAVPVAVAHKQPASDAVSSVGAVSADQRSQVAHTALSSVDLSRATRWGLTEAEWRRYQILMQGLRGSLSAEGISPIEVLGIHARDAAERRQYAERWAQLMYEDTQRVLAFQRAYDAAARRLHGDQPLIDVARLPGRDGDGLRLRTTQLQRGDRLLFFAQPVCAACDALLTQLLSRLDRIAGIDIYLHGIAAGDEDSIREWAAGRGIQPDWVRERRITLNFDAGALARLLAQTPELPVLLRSREGKLARLSATEL